MATYSYDFISKPAVHYSATTHHPQSTHIAGVYDEWFNPLVFSIQKTTSFLYMTIIDPKTGKNSQVNLSSIFGIVGAVTHVAAFQDDNMNVYLSFAVAAGSAVGSSNLFLCQGQPPSVWRETSTLKSLLIPTTETAQIDIQRLHLIRAANAGTFFTDSNYPILVVVFDTPQESQPQVQRVKVDVDLGSWNFVLGEMTITADVVKLVDLAVGSYHADFISLMTLFYDVHNVLQLQASHFDTNFQRGSSVTIPLTAPSGATKLTTVQNVQGNYDLLIAANGLYYYTAAELGAPGSVSKALTPPSDTLFADVSTLIACQSGSTTSIWICTTSGNVCSNQVTAQADLTIALTVSTYPIITSAAITIAPLFSTATQSQVAQHFLYLNADGYHKLLQYLPRNSIWQESLWNVPSASLSTFQSVNSYVTNITVRDSAGHFAGNLAIDFTASDTVTVVANGSTIVLSDQALSISTDKQGRISIITPVTGVGGTSVFKMAVNGVLVGQPLNPASDTEKSLSAVQSATQLNNATLQSDGSSLLAGLGIAPGDVSDIATNIGQVCGQLAKVPPDGSVQDSQAFAASASFPSSLFDDAWACWHWVEQTGAEVGSWIHDTVGNIIALTVTIAGDVKTFVLNSIARIHKALQYLVAQLKLAWERFVDWLGLIFDWKAIEQVKSDMMSITSAIVGQVKVWSGSAVTEIDNALDSAFSALSTILNNIDPTAPTKSSVSTAVVNAASGQSSNPSSLEAPGTDPQTKDTINNPHVNWSRDQLASGGLLDGAYFATNLDTLTLDTEKAEAVGQFVTLITGSNIVEKEISYAGDSNVRVSSKSFGVASGVDDPITTFFENTLIPVKAEAEQTLTTFAQNLQKVVQSSMDGIGDQIIHLFVDLVQSLLTILRTLIEGFLKAAEAILDTVLDALLQAPLTIPFLSTLYEFFTGNQLASVFDITCLLMAIPTSVIGNLSTGKLFWPDMSALPGTISALQFPSLSGIFDNLKSIIESDDATVATTSRPRRRESRHTRSAQVALADGSTAWENYSTSCMIAHPVSCSIEAAEMIISAGYAQTGLEEGTKEEPPSAVEYLAVVAEIIGAAMSFPNQGDDFDGNLLKGARIVELIAWGIRVIELGFTAVLVYKTPENPDGGEVDPNVSTDYAKIKAVISLIFTVAETAYMVTASALRQRNVDEALANSNDPNEATDKVIKNSVGITWGNVFSSALCQGLADASEFIENPEVAADLLAASAIFASCDFYLDLSRGLYLLNQNDGQGANVMYHAVTY